MNNKNTTTDKNILKRKADALANKGYDIAEEVSKMIWSSINTIYTKINNG